MSDAKENSEATPRDVAEVIKTPRMNACVPT